MQTTSETNNTMEAARQAIIDNLSCLDTKREKSLAGEELDETVVRKPSVRSGVVLVIL